VQIGIHKRQKIIILTSDKELKAERYSWKYFQICKHVVDRKGNRETGKTGCGNNYIYTWKYLQICKQVFAKKGSRETSAKQYSYCKLAKRLNLLGLECRFAVVTNHDNEARNRNIQVAMR
jgi:hypothetical protein